MLTLPVLKFGGARFSDVFQSPMDGRQSRIAAEADMFWFPGPVDSNQHDHVHSDYSSP